MDWRDDNLNKYDLSPTSDNVTVHGKDEIEHEYPLHLLVLHVQHLQGKGFMAQVEGGGIRNGQVFLLGGTYNGGLSPYQAAVAQGKRILADIRAELEAQYQEHLKREKQ